MFLRISEFLVKIVAPQNFGGGGVGEQRIR